MLVAGQWSAYTTAACPSRRPKPSWLPTVGYLFELSRYLGSNRFLARSDRKSDGPHSGRARPRGGPSPVSATSVDPVARARSAPGDTDCYWRAPTVVEAMTLSVYNGTALRLDSKSHRLDAAFPFGALSWSRYCPGCIRESHGRWQLIWRLGWSFACAVHNCLLADVCPTCGKYQRQQQVYRRVPTPALCACGESLGAVQTAKLTADHAIAPAQRQVFDVIDSGATSFGAFEANRNSVATCWPPLGAWRMAS